MRKYYRLHTHRVREAIRSQQLKQYWVAEQAGVHRSTLRRWLNHKIVRIHRLNLTRLAGVLQQDWQRLVINSPCQGGKSLDTFDKIQHDSIGGGKCAVFSSSS